MDRVPGDAEAALPDGDRPCRIGTGALGGAIYLFCRGRCWARLGQ
jgi:hypothetical protein